MIKWAVLSSGSCGNCYVFYDGKDSILIDMGLTFTALTLRLASFDIPLESVRGCFVTHLHPDHSKSLGVLSRKLGVPIYISSMAVDAEPRIMARLNIKAELLHRFEFNQVEELFSFHLTPFRTTHDSVGSCGYVIAHPLKNFFVLTDTGTWNEEMVSCMQHSDVLFIESNYDKDLLIKGAYPWPLKKRIMGEYGHLSNTDAMNLLNTANIHYKMVYFIHLSNINNTVDLVSECAATLLSKDISYVVCERGQSYGGLN